MSRGKAVGRVRRRSRGIAVSAILCLVSFGLGYRYRDSRIPATAGPDRIRRPADRAAEPQPAVAPNRTEAGSAGENREPDIPTWKLPVDFLERRGPPVSFNFATGTFETYSIRAFGLDKEAAVALCGEMNACVGKLWALAVSRSLLRTDPDGGHYFEIPLFPEGGAKIRRELENAIAAAFRGAPDDRGKLLAMGAVRQQAFAGFGTERLELAIEENTDAAGNAVSVLRIHSFPTERRMKQIRTHSLENDFWSDRFEALVRQHLPDEQR